MRKTGTVSQAEMAKRKRAEGLKQASFWIKQETSDQLDLLAGMNKSQSMTISLEVGLYALTLVKEQDKDLYFEIVDGDLSGLQRKLKDLLLLD